MMCTQRAAFMAMLIGSVSLQGFGQDAKSVAVTNRFEKDIQAFEAADKKAPPPKGAIVCIGSSSMRGWHETIKSDLAPLTVIPRGFGGSTMKDALYFVNRIVTPYEPRAVVVYEGDNDIASGATPEKVAATFMAFTLQIHSSLPHCRIYYLSTKPSIRRWTIWPKMVEANNLIKSQCEKDKRMLFVDVASIMLDAEGKPKKDIFKEDNLHMTRKGYELWRDVLKPILLKEELASESKK